MPFVVGVLLLTTAPPSGAEEQVQTSVKIVIGSGPVKEDPEDRLLPHLLALDAKGGFRSGAILFDEFDPGEFVARSLKTENFIQLQIDLDNPEETRAALILWVIDQVSKNVKDGKRVEVTFIYRAVVKKG